MTLNRWVRLLELLLVAALIALIVIFLPRVLSGEATEQGSAVALSYASAPQDLNDFLKLSVTDLNTADRDMLMALPEIGEVLSQRILDYRAQHGRFNSWEELSEVKGIGPKVIEALRYEAYIG